MRGLVVFAMLSVFLAVSGKVPVSQARQNDFETVIVTDIVDGDTIDVLFPDGRNERVRYIGMNTTESGESCFSEARAANSDLVMGKEIIMIQDVSNRDDFGRLLRYVFIGGTFVNAELVAGGWAEAVEYPPDVTFAEYFEYLERQALSANLGCHPTGVFAEAASQVVPTSTPAQVTGVTVSTSNQINLRTGPGTDYPIQRTLAAGSANVKAVGRNAAGDWLVLENGSWVAAWVVAVTGDVYSLPIHDAPAVMPSRSEPVQPVAPIQPAVPIQPPAQTLPSRSSACNCGKTCSQMVSCDEAYFQLQQCGCTARDSDGDGVPCESICPGG